MVWWTALRQGQAEEDDNKEDDDEEDEVEKEVEVEVLEEEEEEEEEEDGGDKAEEAGNFVVLGGEGMSLGLFVINAGAECDVPMAILLELAPPPPPAFCLAFADWATERLEPEKDDNEEVDEEE